MMESFSRDEHKKLSAAATDASELLKLLESLPDVPELKFAQLTGSGLRFCSKWTDPPVVNLSLKQNAPPPSAVSGEFAEWLHTQHTNQTTFVSEASSTCTDMSNKISEVETDRSRSLQELTQRQKMSCRLLKQEAEYEVETKQWKKNAKEREDNLKKKWNKLQDKKDKLNRLRHQVRLTCESLEVMTNELRTEYEEHIVDIDVKKDEFQKKHEALFAKRKETQEAVAELTESIEYQKCHLSFLQNQRTLLNQHVTDSVSAHTDVIYKAHLNHVAFLKQFDTPESKHQQARVVFANPFCFESDVPTTARIKLSSKQTGKYLTHNCDQEATIWQAMETGLREFTLSTTRFEDGRLVRTYLQGTNSSGGSDVGDVPKQWAFEEVHNSPGSENQFLAILSSNDGVLDICGDSTLVVSV